MSLKGWILPAHLHASFKLRLHYVEELNCCCQNMKMTVYAQFSKNMLVIHSFLATITESYPSFWLALAELALEAIIVLIKSIQWLMWYFANRQYGLVNAKHSNKDLEQ